MAVCNWFILSDIDGVISSKFYEELATMNLNKGEWMQCPDIDVEYPGLAYIYPLDELIIAEKRDALHDIIGTRAQITYTIYNRKGQKIFVAVRIKGWKNFTIKIYNNYGNKVIEVKKPFKFCVNRVLVWAPAGHFAGSVEQVGCLCRKYDIKNNNGKKVLHIKKQREVSLVYNIHYILGVKPIGFIEKQPSRPVVTDVKSFGVTFPVHLNVEDKAVLLGACFLISYLKF